MTPLGYKSHVMRTIIYPINEQFFDSRRTRNIRYFTKYKPHIFGRVLERGIDQETFKEIFELLFKHHYEHLLGIFENDKEKMKSDNSVAIFVRRSDVSICFIVFDDEVDGFFSMIPVTVLGKYGYKKCDYEIEL